MLVVAPSINLPTRRSASAFWHNRGGGTWSSSATILICLTRGLVDIAADVEPLEDEIAGELAWGRLREGNWAFDWLKRWSRLPSWRKLRWYTGRFPLYNGFWRILPLAAVVAPFTPTLLMLRRACFTLKNFGASARNPSWRRAKDVFDR